MSSLKCRIENKVMHELTEQTNTNPDTHNGLVFTRRKGGGGNMNWEKGVKYIDVKNI